MGQRHSIEDTIFEMRLKSRELKRMSDKAVKEERAEKNKVKKAIEKGNKDGARIFAQNAIRKGHESINYLQLSSKMDAVASRLDASHRSQQMTKDIHSAVPDLAKALNALDISTLARGMDRFEKLFEDLDVRADYVSTAIDSTTASATPVDQVDALLSQVAEEHALDVTSMLSNAPIGAVGKPAVSITTSQGKGNESQRTNVCIFSQAATKTTASPAALPADPLGERLRNL